MLNERSERNLVGVHPALVGVVRRAAELVQEAGPHLGFVVTEGLRSQARQTQLVRAGASRTMNSRHLTGHAVDLAATVDGDVRWDWPLYAELARFMNKAAAEQGVQIVWGGNWASFRDGPHFELDRQAYSA
jgi:peptidoglycan L-alanyl-D-glutamate endopeptidase CwlK